MMLDLSVFDISFIPPKLLFRESEFNQILNYLFPSNIKPSGFNALFISGDKGVGKTITSIFIKKYVESNNLAKVYYFQFGRRYKKTLSYFLLNTFGISKYYKDLSIFDVLHIIKEADNPEKIILIYDDFHNIEKSKDQLLFNTFESAVKLFKYTGLMLISQTSYIKIKKELSSGTISRMRFKFIGFRPYLAPELFGILKQRVDLILNDYEEGALKLIAAFVARIGGDARYALEITRKAIEKGKLTLKSAENAVKWAKTNFWANEITKLPPHMALYLVALAKSVNPIFLYSDEAPTDSQSAREVYIKLCNQYGVDPMSNAMISYSLNKLEMLGFIKKIKFERRGRGRGTNWQILLTEKPTNILMAAKTINWMDILL